MTQKRKSSDASSASKPKISRDVLSISEKVKILDMIEIKKNRTRLLRIRLKRIRISYFHTYERERKNTVNVKCSVQYTLLYLMLIMSYCA